MAATPLKLFVSTPFRSFGTPRLFPDAVFGAGEKTKGRYVDALLAEIESAAADMDGFVVNEVEFGFGPASGIETSRLMEVVRSLRAHFTFSSDACIHALEIPGCLTVDFAGFCKNIGMAYLEIETLTTDVRALRASGLPYQPQDTVEAFQVTYFTGLPHLGILLDATFGGDEAPLRRTATDVVGRSPAFVRVTRADKNQLDLLGNIFVKHGLLDRGGGVFTREGFAGLSPSPSDQLGLGLGAVTRLDGLAFKTTHDLSLYLEHSAEFETVSRQI